MRYMTWDGLQAIRLGLEGLVQAGKAKGIVGIQCGNRIGAR